MVHRIDGTSAAVALPAAGAVVGTPGYFSEGNPGTGTPATIVTQAWANMVQEELVAVLTEAGVTPAKGSNGQVMTALATMFPGLVPSGRSVFASGYIKLPGGLIVQYGAPVVTAGSGISSVYPITFPNIVYAVVGTISDASTSGDFATMSSFSTSAIGIRTNAPGSRTVSYIAIGR